MKYILLLLCFILCGCFTPRELVEKDQYIKELQDNNLQRSIELLKLQDQLAHINAFYNIPRPLTVRQYKVPDPTSEAGHFVLKAAIPEDFMLSVELEARTNTIKNVFVSDNTYWLPSKEFLEEVLLPAYRATTKGLVYSTKFDCDDFSRICAIFAQRFYTKNVLKPAEAISFGEVYYKRNNYLNIPMIGDLPIILSKTAHAINIIMLDDLTICFVEPQTGKLVKLEENEMESITFVRF